MLWDVFGAFCLRGLGLEGLGFSIWALGSARFQAAWGLWDMKTRSDIVQMLDDACSPNIHQHKGENRRSRGKC